MSRDGVRLAATYIPAPAARPAPATETPAVVLAHGFAGHRRKPTYALLAQGLSRDIAVLTIDLRGHGASAGACTLGDLEVADVRAAAAWLRRRGHTWVAVVGASMGGSAAIRAAGCGPPGVFDAVCTVSAPAQWGLRDTPPMRAINRLSTNAVYRAAAGAALRVRIATRWAHPPQPVDVVGAIAPTPLLVVHGTDDHYFGPEQANLLYAAAGEPRTLWLEPAGFGHAEDGFTPSFIERLGHALRVVAETGRWPAASGTGAAERVRERGRE